MPTYRSAGVRMTLEVSDIALSTTDKIESWNAPEAREQVDNANSALENGCTLNEQPVLIDGRSSMAFLGVKKDMPFFLAHINGERLNESFPGMHMLLGGDAAKRMRSGRAAITIRNTPTNYPPACCLTMQKPRTKIVISRKSGKTSSQTKAKQMTSIKIKGKSCSFNIIREGKEQVPPNSASRTLKVFSSSVSDHTSSRISIQSDHESSPKALTLAVRLDPDNPVWHTANGSSAFDVKIEIFYNGEFAACSLVTSKARNMAKDLFTRRFSGKRWHKVAEDPWIFDPTEAHSKPGGKQTNSNRWLTIGKMLQEEASSRGVSSSSMRPPTGQYLAALSQLKMPEALRHICHISARRMGVIDVVLSLGKGRKFMSKSHYITRPTRLPDPAYRGLRKESRSEVCVWDYDIAKIARREESRESDDSRLPDRTIVPAIAWSRAVSLSEKSKSKSGPSGSSCERKRSNNAEKNSSPADTVKSSISVLLPTCAQRMNQAITQADGFSYWENPVGTPTRKKPVQGSGPTQKHSGSDVVLHETRSSRIEKSIKRHPWNAKASQISKRPKTKKQPHPSPSAQSLTRPSPCDSHPEAIDPIDESDDSPLSSSISQDHSPTSPTEDSKVAISRSSKRGLRVGSQKNYAEASSSSSPDHVERRIGANDYAHSPAHRKVLNGAQNLSDEAVASYVKDKAWCDTGQGGQQGGQRMLIRQVKQEKNGEFMEDSILVGVRFVLV